MAGPAAGSEVETTSALGGDVPEASMSVLEDVGSSERRLFLFCRCLLFDRRFLGIVFRTWPGVLTWGYISLLCVK